MNTLIVLVLVLVIVGMIIYYFGFKKDDNCTESEVKNNQAELEEQSTELPLTLSNFIKNGQFTISIQFANDEGEFGADSIINIGTLVDSGEEITLMLNGALEIINICRLVALNPILVQNLIISKSYFFVNLDLLNVNTDTNWFS